MGGGGGWGHCAPPPKKKKKKKKKKKNIIIYVANASNSGKILTIFEQNSVKIGEYSGKDLEKVFFCSCCCWVFFLPKYFLRLVGARVPLPHYCIEEYILGAAGKKKGARVPLLIHFILLKFLSSHFWRRIKVSKRLSRWVLQMINAKLFGIKTPVSFVFTRFDSGYWNMFLTWERW